MPSYATGLQVGERLARTGTPWINLRVTTPTGYANQLLSGSLAAAGRRLLEHHESLLIIETLYRVNQTLQEGRQYFGSVETMPGIIKCLGRAVTEMRMAGTEAGLCERCSSWGQFKIKWRTESIRINPNEPNFVVG